MRYNDAVVALVVVAPDGDKDDGEGSVGIGARQHVPGLGSVRAAEPPAQWPGCPWLYAVALAGPAVA